MTKATKFPLTEVEAKTRKEALTYENSYQIHYNLLLTLRSKSHPHSNHKDYDFEGRVRIDFTFGKTNEDSLLVNFVGQVHHLEVNGVVAKYDIKPGKILVDKYFLKENSQNSMLVHFSAKYTNSGIGLHHFTDPNDGKEYLYTQFEAFECHLVFPVFDQPDLKARLDMNLIAPSDWTVLSNEYPRFTKAVNSSTLEDFDMKSWLGLSPEEHSLLLESILSKNYSLSVFNTTHRISCYLYALAAGPYYCFNNPVDFRVPMKIYLRDSLKKCGDPLTMFQVTMAGVDFYEDYFGFKFPFNKYDQIYVPEYNFGAMENVGLVTYNEVYAWKGEPLFAREARFVITILHELAHMWFGNMVTMKWWDDLWLNESFATFISYLACAHSKAIIPRYRNSAWPAFNKDKNMGYSEDQKSTTHSVMSEIKDTDECQANFDMIVYCKGSSILKQMYYFIGHEEFSNGLKAYFTKFQWQNTTFYDFIDTMAERVSDKIDLTALACSWLKKAGLTEISIELKTADGKIANAEVIQKACLQQHNNLQTLMLDILLIYSDHTTENIPRVVVNPEERTVIGQLVGRRSPVAVILNHNDWAYAKWIVDKSTIEYIRNNYSKISDPLDRQLIAKSLFEMSKDTKISSLTYLDLALSALQQEEDDQLLLIILAFVASTVNYYIPRQKVGDYCKKLFELVISQLEAALKNFEKSKEKCKVLLSHSILFCVCDSHREILKTILTENKLSGIELNNELINTDTRFSLLRKVFESRLVDKTVKEELLEVEVKRDNNSDLAQRARCSCYAALPDKEVKRDVWNRIKACDNKESLYMLREYMLGFVVYDQLEIIEEYLTKDFFEVALEITSKNEYHLTRFFMSYLRPNYFASKELVERCQQFETKSSNSDYVRSIKELYDDLQRFLKVQENAEKHA